VEPKSSSPEPSSPDRSSLESTGLDPSSPEHVLSFLGRLGERLDRLALPARIEQALGRQDVACVLSNLRRRLREGPDAPLRVAFFGPTGAGKSKVFNSLSGKVVSPSGFRRPFTMRSVYLAHERQRQLLEGSPGETRFAGDEGWRDLILIDTPDFDSVEKQNRDEAERVFREAEAFLFVTDVQKYADHATWEYLRRIFAEAKPLILVLNKVVSEGAGQDFFSRIDRSFGGAARGVERIVVREYPLDDAALLPSEDGGLRAIRAALERLAGSSGERRATLNARFRSDLHGFLELWGRAEELLALSLLGLSEVERRLGSRSQEEMERLATRLDVQVDPALRAEVFAKVQDRLQRIDLLRYPRRLLALPLEGLKVLLRRWIPGQEASSAAEEDPSRGETFQFLEGSVLGLFDGLKEDVRGEPRCWPLLAAEEILSLRFSHDEVKSLYDDREVAFREWLRAEARDTASTLTGEHKLKFILSQVIYNSVVVGIQIHTAGGFTLAEFVADGVLSPIVAKAVGLAVSSDAVRRFERKAKAEHRRVLAGVIEEARSRVAAYLERQAAWRADFDALRDDARALADARDRIEALFAEAGGASGGFVGGRGEKPSSARGGIHG